MSLFKTIAELEESQTPFAIVTIINATESSPGRTAFKMVVTQTASWGSVGGGTLEYQAQKLAREAMIRRIPTQTLSVDLTDEALGGNGMACGGHADLLIETFQPAPKLFIFGGGHIGTALTNIMSRCGFEVTVIDNRAEFSDKARHPSASQTLCLETYRQVAKLEFPQKAWFVIVTHGHVGDEDCLLGLLSHEQLQAAYIGLIGSAKKLGRVFADIIDKGAATRDALMQVHAPIGLDLGGQSADEIAVAIAAEIIATRYDKDISNAMRYQKPVVF